MPARFYIPLQRDEPCVEPATAHHLIKVMRTRVGQTLACFDGCGTTYDATVRSIKGKHIELELVPGSMIEQPASTPTIHVALALLKGAAMDRAIAAAVELGAAQISLLTSERVNVHVTDTRLENKLAHWHKIAQGACEQSGQATLPIFNPPCPLERFLEDHARRDEDLVLTDAEGEVLAGGVPPRMVVVVGPEGGFSPAELAVLRRHAKLRLSLGPLVLRAETVPAAALAVLRQQHDQASSGTASTEYLAG
ncbi:MAG: RsmE family RNA methyltransferase [Pseudomonadota bacterium]